MENVQDELLQQQIKMWFMEATTHHQSQRYDEAWELYQKVIQQEPTHADSLHLLGLIEGERGNTDKALQWINRAIQHQPTFGAYYFNRGLLYRKQQQIDLAIADFRRAVVCQPDFLPAWLQLGDAFIQIGASQAAIGMYQQAKTLAPNALEVLHGLGTAYLADEQYETALDCFAEIQRRNAGHLEALINQGVALLGLNRAMDAIILYKNALTTHPNHLQLLTNLALAYAQTEQWQHAEATNQAIIENYPEDSQAHSNLGVVYKEQGKYGSALTEFTHALELNPDNVEAEFNLAITELLLGAWQSGWQHYESRLRLKEAQRLFRELPPFTAPRWQGENLQGKTLLVIAEQGIGDTFQFIRYLPKLKAQGATIIVECQPEIKKFLSTQITLGISHLMSRGEQRPLYHYFIPLLSLAGMLKTFDASSIPFKHGYLKSTITSPSLSATDKHLRVGIVWAGNPQHRNDKHRSIPLAALNPLLDMPDVAFYSLQYGGRSQDIQAHHLQEKLIDLSHHIQDFRDTAALLMQLDVVITVDTSLAHLSGALGRPTWILLPFVPDFRWGLDTENSVWYDAVRLFRQPTRNDWDSVLNEVKTALGALSQQKG